MSDYVDIMELSFFLLSNCACILVDSCLLSIEIFCVQSHTIVYLSGTSK